MGNAIYKAKHRKLKLCLDCSRPVYPGRVRCLIHLRHNTDISRKYQLKIGDVYLKQQKDRRQRRKNEGLCTSCSAPIGDGYAKCQNCRERIHQARTPNAYSIV